MTLKTGVSAFQKFDDSDLNPLIFSGNTGYSSNMSSCSSPATLSQGMDDMRCGMSE